MAGENEAKPERDARGRWLPGSSGGPGRPKGSRSWMTMLRQHLKRPLTEAELERLFDLFEVPEDLRDELMLVENRQEALAFLTVQRALRGNTDLLREVLDRIAPKKAALELEVNKGPGVRLLDRGDVSEESQAQRDYFDALTAGQDVLDVDFREVDEPEEVG